ncbi:DUF2155 domain-containing protein [Litoreibacter roseus]|uniref:DUF2155 domain-containing protein n=1 Tax=Litoreibacter roseus TaxID=2601869 RepID=A0A6N6JL66_9RHOB|nr:DUF2155 domain-containing protein [Litoreibacter roseus]GFE66149.1 hypothetical protein KIN_32230 [Litoreibacter roseus]
MIRAAFTAALLLTQSAAGQVIEGDTSPETIQGDNSTFRIGPARGVNNPRLGRSVSREVQESVSSAPVALLRGLDKMSGESSDLQLVSQEPQRFGTLTLEMGECRYPIGNPNGDAYVQMRIYARDVQEPVFDGWMVASSPALMALDHPRYDVWAIRCKLDEQTPLVADEESSRRPVMRP